MKRFILFMTLTALLTSLLAVDVEAQRRRGRARGRAKSKAAARNQRKMAPPPKKLESAQELKSTPTLLPLDESKIVPPQTKAEAKRSEGMTLIRQGKHKEALDAFEAGLKLEPDNVYLLISCGDVLVTLKRVEDARTHYKKAEATALQQYQAEIARQVQAKSAVIAVFQQLTLFDRASIARYTFEALHPPPKQ